MPEFSISSMHRVPMLNLNTVTVRAKDAAEAIWRYLQQQKALGTDLRGRCLLIKLEGE
jgi:hypothetical protein